MPTDRKTPRALRVPLWLVTVAALSVLAVVAVASVWVDPPLPMVVAALALVLIVGILGATTTIRVHRSAGDSWAKAVVRGLLDGVRFLFDVLP